MTTTATDALSEFRATHPAYDETAALDELRAKEYARLDAEGQIYLDYTGGGLYADVQLREHMDILRAHTFGNPHSCNPTSQAATVLCEDARAEVLRYFRADPQEYTAIFTLNASGALKLVGESYPFAHDGRYLLTVDNHNSVNGIREFARARNAEVTYLPVREGDLRLDPATVGAELGRLAPGAAGLFAFPAQSNFSGVQHDLGWIAAAQAKGWDVLLDAAAFAPTNRLDLSVHKPDFVAISFYKIFGYPTGIGALIVRRDSLTKLRRPWFAGGTITIASAQGGGHFLAAGETGFEDGTINYLGLPAVTIGLRHMEAAGIERIHQRVELLAGWLLGELAGLRHRNGRPLVTIYGPTDTEGRGGTLAMNFYDSAGERIDFRAVEQQASDAGISLRSGCFCNPGVGEVINGLTGEDMAAYFREFGPISFDDFINKLAGRATGAVRVSLGIASTFADAQRFMAFARTMLQ
ncbi:aminotransferase class V-fold PLP-dependent enzyme [Oscillochloris sp. ZM17-4]|uniref:aminotransferase class V-fold PLP-dependent enzyme n=1 Tax=Oscillochloris sp. ZM17-4 TaxID=2866714 RepID=UPI001C73935D|nr:aminotransferase class V-fold PLP-dependent enzyme [Oscillochloris sp. ZM17-4]MBX0331147.1 aminotransferase class V-fold PLP-dependent enzyme [Oscillochloris sp. ZM17-4]